MPSCLAVLREATSMKHLFLCPPSPSSEMFPSTDLTHAEFHS